jgi:hypothetical protein
VPDPEADDPPVTAGDMRFRAVLRNGSWSVTHALPAVAKEDLEAALEILGWVHGTEPFVARDEAEARAVVELALAGNYFGNEKKDQPVASGATIKVRKRMWRHYLAMVLFRHRFVTGPWDTTSSHEADAAFNADMDKLFADIGAQIGQALAAPHGEETVYQGQRSAFLKARMSELEPRAGLVELFRALYPSRDLGESFDLPRAVDLIDESMDKAGLATLGDMVCEAFGEVVIRGYARYGGDAFGLLYAGTTGQFAYEFSTHFTDGSSLTTSVNPGSDRREIASYHAHFPGASVEELFEKHQAGVAKRSRGEVKPMEHPHDLAALAARIDEFLVRSAA